MPRRREGEAAPFVVKSTVRALMKERKFRCGDRFLDALNVRVAELVKDAARRADLNGRTTVKDYDLG